MLQLYDHSYLIVEGYYRCDTASGLVQGWRGGVWKDIVSGRQRLTWTGLDSWLTSIETLGGLRVRRTVTENETVQTVQSLYTWWQRDDHKSLKVFNTTADAAAINRPGLLRRMAAELPLIGWERSSAVAKHFGTVVDMVNAGPLDWMQIDGIGKGIATKVVEALNEPL
jgi:ERCC4-type nuclease